jgi:hypothetical protein
LFFWALSPVLFIFVVAMPFLIQKHDATAIAILVGLEVTGVFMLLGLWNPIRFAWAWRGVGAAIFLAYVVYIVVMLFERKWQIPNRRAEENLWNAIMGMIAFGLPGLWWALRGRFPTAFASLDQRQSDKSATQED